MSNNARASTALAKLSRREREIMDVLFQKGQATVAEVVEALADPPSYSAVRAMLVRLEAKGYIRHDVDGQRYLYSATTSHGTARRAALKQYVKVFFGGSPGELMTTLLRQETWTDDELDTLRAEIDRVKKERKRS